MTTVATRGRSPAAPLVSMLGLASLCVACTPEPAPPPSDDPRWASRLERLGGAIVVTGSAAVEGSEPAARDRLREQLFSRAAEEAVVDALGAGANVDPIGLKNVHRARDRWARARILEEASYQSGARLGMRLQVEVQPDLLRQVLEQEGLLVTRRSGVIVVLRKGEAEGAADVVASHRDDIAGTLSKELKTRGYVPRLWNDVRQEVGQDRMAGDAQVEELLVKYVEDSDWHRPDDERYDLPLILLRSRGRFLAGFRVMELRRTRSEVNLPGEPGPIEVESIHLTARGDLYDLLDGTALGVVVKSGVAAIGPGRTEVEVRAGLVLDLAKQLALELANELGELEERERRLRGRTYELAFEGYSRAEQERIEVLLSRAVSEDVRSEGAGKPTLTVRVDSTRDPIPFREELRRGLRALGLTPTTVDGQAERLTFRR